MERSVRFALACVAVSLLISGDQVGAWYKQSTGPSYYSVGRASGLLSGIRRSPHARRSESESEEAVPDSEEAPGNSVIPDNRQISVLKSMVSVAPLTHLSFSACPCFKSKRDARKRRCRCFHLSERFLP